MMSSNDKRKFIRLLDKFEAAVRSDEMRGSFPPEEMEEVRLAYIDLRRDVLDLVGTYTADSLSGIIGR